MLRSKSPDLVLQEICRHLCCHYAIRTLMAQAALNARRDPDRVKLRRSAADHPPIYRPPGRLSPSLP